MIRLHLGCGRRFIPGFVHVDLANYSHIDHIARVDQLSFIEDESVELIYSSHTFEYFDRAEATLVLTEWRRVLATGGTLRLAVPDFEAIVEAYRRGFSLDKLVGPLFGRMEIAGTPQMIYHKTTYDFVSLTAVLEQAGFTNVRRYDWRNTIHSAHDDHSQAYLPHMDKANGLLISLNVECTK